MDWLDQIKWDADGLVPAIAQDAKTGEILMMA
ncbi:MAG: phosphoribosyl-AMP cyclohydrolase, partial [Gammaproteobacteria bacterium]|nr:phosphoribosyl-AMP cyclohydrolase [Gammaproteobacteria bacterium]